MKDRTGQQVRINVNPDVIYEIKSWSETRQKWVAECITPSGKFVQMFWSDAFLKYLEESYQLYNQSAE